MTDEVGNSPISPAEIQAAIDGRQFSLCYQPKLDFGLLNLKGFEALIRWEHPTRGLVLPDQFIALAEETGLIGKITEQVVDQAFRWYKSTAGTHGHTLSINFSAKRLSDDNFADWLLGVCRRAAMRPDAVILEISEAGMMEHRLSAHDMFTRLKTKGFHVAIDDYGVGTSSKLLLPRLPISEIKIHKSFAMRATQSEEARAFIKSTVELGHSLKIAVSAGGVEDRETLDFLRKIGCDYAYGFLISRPMSGDQAAEWIVHRRQLTSSILF